ncbi:hypothetical protein GYH30_017815 [Glycine max]|nr:hypothetical protein GYH30_017815 [Glycine max]
MLNTEVGAVLAVIRRPKFTPLYNIPSSEDSYTTLPSSVPYDPFALSFSTFSKSGAPSALSSVLKILKFEDAVMMKILQVLTGIMHHRASALLADQSVCTLVDTCFQVVQQSATRGDLLQRSARYTMHELIQVVFARLTEIEPKDREGDSESGMEDGDEGGGLESGYGVRCAIDIFHFFFEADGSTSHTADEDVQIFALVLINSATELSGDEIGKRPKLLRMIQDDLFHHLIYYILDMLPNRYISRTPRIEAADVGLGYFPIHPLHAQHLLGLVREPQMVGTRRSGSEDEVPRSEPALIPCFRFYLESFWLPGESQNIQCVLEAFMERFYDHQSSDMFANKDTKMTEEEFIRNNRAINAGKDLPREYLSELFQSISTCAFSLEQTTGSLDMNPSRICRDMFACIAGPVVAALSSFFEHADEEEMLHECIEGLLSVARICQYGLEDTLDEFITSFCKFTTLLNPYASIEETMFTFSHDLKPRMATVAVFTIANYFRDSIQGGWKNIVDCLLKLKKIKLLPQSVVDFKSVDVATTPESGVMSPTDDHKFGSQRVASMISWFSHLSIFSNYSNIPKECLQSLGRSLIFAAAGKGQKFTNVHKFHIFWPNFHEYLLSVAQFPMFSPIPFAEKAILGLLRVCLKLFSAPRDDKLAEELIFKSITLMWKLDKEIFDTCHDVISQLISKIHIEYPANALIALFSDGSCISGTNYAYCVVCAFGCFLARNSSVDKKKILDLLADSVKLLIHWHRNQYSDPGSNVSIASYTSNSSFKDNSRGSASANYNMNLFVKLGEAFRRTSLSRQEEIRNHAVSSLYKSFGVISFNLAEELHYMSSNRINYFNFVIFAMVDELHEKMLEYSRRENAERESRSTEETLKLAMELLSDMYLQSLRQITESSGFRTFWSGILRRKDTCMKADLGQYGPSTLGEIIPDLLRKIITQMKEEGILEPRYVGDYIYLDTVDICPHLKDELFPL